MSFLVTQPQDRGWVCLRKSFCSIENGKCDRKVKEPRALPQTLSMIGHSSDLPPRLVGLRTLALCPEVCSCHLCPVSGHCCHPQRKPFPLGSHSPFLPLPAPGNHNLPSVSVDFGRFHINGIIEHVAFVSGSFHLVKCSQAPRVAHHVIPLRPNTLPSWERPVSFPIH